MGQGWNPSGRSDHRVRAPNTKCSAEFPPWPGGRSPGWSVSNSPDRAARSPSYTRAHGCGDFDTSAHDRVFPTRTPRLSARRPCTSPGAGTGHSRSPATPHAQVANPGESGKDPKVPETRGRGTPKRTISSRSLPGERRARPPADATNEGGGRILPAHNAGQAGRGRPRSADLRHVGRAPGPFATKTGAGPPPPPGPPPGRAGPTRGEQALPRPPGRAGPLPTAAGGPGARGRAGGGRGGGRRSAAAGPGQRRRPGAAAPSRRRHGRARRASSPRAPRGSSLQAGLHLPEGGGRAWDPGPGYTRPVAAADPAAAGSPRLRAAPTPAGLAGPPPPLESAPRNGRPGSPLAAAAAARASSSPPRAPAKYLSLRRPPWRRGPARGRGRGFPRRRRGVRTGAQARALRGGPGGNGGGGDGDGGRSCSTLRAPQTGGSTAAAGPWFPGSGAWSGARGVAGPGRRPRPPRWPGSLSASPGPARCLSGGHPGTPS